MRLPLDHPIWSRLYGPYGVQNVPDQLTGLLASWDKARADELFWDMLHHQDDLYPVTYAALPWVWDHPAATPALEMDRLCFFSHILYCATAPYGTGCDGTGPRGKYRGLSLRAEDHEHGWLPKNLWLTSADMTVLSDLQHWFDATAPHIAESCVENISEATDYEAFLLCTGYCAKHGSSNTAHALMLCADGEPWHVVQAEVSLEAEDLTILKRLAEEVGGANTQLARTLAQMAARGVAHVPKQPLNLSRAPS